LTPCVECRIIFIEMNPKDQGKMHKILGAGIGWIVGGPVGAALGLLVGHTLQDHPDLLEKESGNSRLRQHYDVLEVPYNAGTEEIKTAYKRMARKYHPDRFRDADPVLQELAKEKMTEINEAHSRIMGQIESRGGSLGRAVD
jgi:DnaJ-domain-containing protein 1